MTICGVIGCSSNDKSGSHISFHRLPSDPITADLWKKAIGLYNISKNTKICSLHFNSSCFDKSKEQMITPTSRRRFLFPKSVPSIFLGGNNFAKVEKPEKDYSLTKELIGTSGTSHYYDVTKNYKNEVNCEKYNMNKRDSRVIKIPDRKLNDSYQYSHQSSNISPSSPKSSHKDRSSLRHTVFDTNHYNFSSHSENEKYSKIKNESTLITQKINTSPTSFPDSRNLSHQKFYEENINYNLHFQDLRKKSISSRNTTRTEGSEINITKKGSVSEPILLQGNATEDSNSSTHSQQKPFYHSTKEKYDSQKNEDLVQQKMLLMQYKKNNAILAQNINTLYMLNQLNTATNIPVMGINPQLISPISPLTADSNQTVLPLASFGPSLNHVVSPSNVFTSDFKSQSNLFASLVSPCNQSQSSPPASEIYLRNLKQKTDRLSSPPQSFPPASEVYLKSLKLKTDQLSSLNHQPSCLPSGYDNSVINKIQFTDVEELIFLKNAVDTTLQKKFSGSENNLSALNGFDGQSATHSVKSLSKPPAPYSKPSAPSENKSSFSINLTKNSLVSSNEKPSKLSLSDYHSRRNQWNFNEPTKSSSMSHNNNRLVKSQSQSGITNNFNTDQTPPVKLALNEKLLTVNKTPELSNIDSSKETFCTISTDFSDEKKENTHIEDEYLEFMKSITGLDIIDNNKDDKDIHDKDTQSSPILNKIQSLQYLPENKSDTLLKNNNKVVEQFAFNSIRADTPSATVTLQQAKNSSKFKQSISETQLFNNNKLLSEKSENVLKIEPDVTNNVSPFVSTTKASETQVTTMDTSEAKKTNMQQKTKYTKSLVLAKSVETLSVPVNPKVEKTSQLGKNKDNIVKVIKQQKGAAKVEKKISNQVKGDKKMPFQQKADVKAEKGSQQHQQKGEDVVKLILQLQQQKDNAKVEKTKPPQQNPKIEKPPLNPKIEKTQQPLQQKDNSKIEKTKQLPQQKDFSKVEKIPQQHKQKADEKVEKELHHDKGYDIVKLILQLQQQKDDAKVENVTQSHLHKTDEKIDQALPDQQKADDKLENLSQKGDKVVKLVLQLHQKKDDAKETVNNEKSLFLKDKELNPLDILTLSKKKLLVTDQSSMLPAKKKVKTDIPSLTASKINKPVNLCSFLKTQVKEILKKKDMAKNFANESKSKCKEINDNIKENQVLKPITSHRKSEPNLVATENNITLEETLTEPNRNVKTSVNKIDTILELKTNQEILTTTIIEPSKNVRKSSKKVDKAAKINQQVLTTRTKESNKDDKKISIKVGTNFKENKDDLTNTAEYDKNDNKSHIDTTSKVNQKNLINNKSVKCKLPSEEESNHSDFCEKVPEKANLKLVIKTKGHVTELLCKPDVVAKQNSVTETSATSIDSEKMNKKESQKISNTEFDPEVEPLVLGKRRSKATLKKKAYYEYLRKREARHKAAKEAAEKQRRLADAEKQAKHLKKKEVLKHNQTLQAIKDNENLKSFVSCLKEGNNNDDAKVSFSHSSNDLFTLIQSSDSNQSVFQKGVTYQCKKCKDCFTTISSLTKHILVHEKLSNLEQIRNVNTPNDKKTFVCVLCSKSHDTHFVTIQDYCFHLMSQHSLSYEKASDTIIKNNLIPKHPKKFPKPKKKNLDIRPLSGSEVLSQNETNNKKPNGASKIIKAKEVVMRIKKLNLENQLKSVNNFKINNEQIPDVQVSLENENINSTKVSVFSLSDAVSNSKSSNNVTKKTESVYSVNTDYVKNDKQEINDLDLPLSELSLNKHDILDVSKEIPENVLESQTSKKVTNSKNCDPFDVNKVDTTEGFENKEEEKERIKSQFISAERTARTLVRNQRKNLSKTHKNVHSSSDSRKDYITIEQLDALKVKVRVKTTIANETVSINGSSEADNLVITNNKRSKKSKKRKLNHKKTSKKPSDQPVKKRKKYYVYEHELYNMQTEPNLINSFGIDSSNFSKTSDFKSNTDFTNLSGLFNESENEKILATYKNINYDSDYDYKNQAEDVFVSKDIFLTEDEITSSLLTLNDNSIDADTLERIHESYLRVVQYDVKQTLDDIITLITKQLEASIKPDKVCRSMTPCPYLDHEYFFQSKTDFQISTSKGVSENINILSNGMCDDADRNKTKDQEFQKNQCEKISLQFVESPSVFQIESILCPNIKISTDSHIDSSLCSYMEVSCIESSLESHDKSLSGSQIESTSIHIESDFNIKPLDFKTKIVEDKFSYVSSKFPISPIENNFKTGTVNSENSDVLTNDINSGKFNVSDVQYEIKSLLKELLDNILNPCSELSVISKNGICSNNTATDAIFDCSDKSTLHVQCCLEMGELSISAKCLNEFKNDSVAIGTEIQLNSGIFENSPFTKDDETIGISKKNFDLSDFQKEQRCPESSLKNLYNLNKPFSIDSKTLNNFDMMSPIHPTIHIDNNFGNQFHSSLVNEPLSKSIENENFFFNSSINIKQEILDDEDDDDGIDIHKFSMQNFSQTALTYFTNVEVKEEKTKLFSCPRKRLYSCDKYNSCSSKNIKSMDSYLQQDCFYNSKVFKKKNDALKHQYTRYKNCISACECQNMVKFTKLKDSRLLSSLEAQEVSFENSTRKKHTCKKCNAQFPSHKIFCRHQMFFHKNSLNDCKCLICGQSFLRRFYLHSHLKKHSEFRHRSSLTL
ncbi:uncharacterized protein LOC136080505 isoform X2 [Hydra vulgaris]|uniref:Uncharacterized protein LOC136080505 isoform X2 n=1 Tax=Hydra vulgaris TaxID=6087 RepID=A0ABM4BVT6_HYDVU